MHLYSPAEWVAFFLFYCFIGWIIESAYVSAHQRHFVNRGFMRGPCLPLYGFGALTILHACAPVHGTPVLVFLLGMLSCSALEYLTGALMELLFKTKYWDYSARRFNLHGRICLGTSLAWGALSMAMIYIVHAPVERLILMIPETPLTIVVCCLSAIALADFAFALRTALSLNAVLKKLTELHGELENLRAQLDDTIMHTEHGRALVARIEAVRTERAELTSRLRSQIRRFVDAHPTASSRRFNEALTELKQRVRERRKKDAE